MRNVSIENKGGEVLDGKEAIAQYKEWYFEFYGVKPTEKLIETFCKMKGIDIEQVRKQAREEVAKVENQAEYKVCSVLEDVPTVTTASVQIPYTEENFRALETNYQNLLAEFQEVSAIALEQKQTIEDDNALIVKLSINVGKMLNILDYHKDLLSPSDIGKLKEIKKEVL
jgi:succinyl-CoA synthetase beta subunit